MSCFGTLTDHINTNSVLDCDIIAQISKIDISNHFQMFLISEETDINLHNKDFCITLRYISSKQICEFKRFFSEVNLERATQSKDANSACFQTFISESHDIAFPEQNKKNKLNPLSTNTTKWSNTLKQLVGKLFESV